MKKEIEHELPYYCPTLDGSGFSKYRKLRNGSPINKPVYTFDVHSYSEAYEIKESSRITNDVWYLNFAANTIICLDFNEAKHSLLLKLDYQIQEAERYL